MDYDKLVDDTLDSIQKPLYEINYDEMLETINWMVEKYGVRDTRRFIKREGWLNGMPKNLRRSFNERLFITQNEGFWSDLAKPRKLTPEEIAANKKKKKRDTGKAARVFGGGTYGVAVDTQHRKARATEDIEFEDAPWLFENEDDPTKELENKIPDDEKENEKDLMQQESLITEGECFKQMMKKEGISSLKDINDEQKKIFFKKVKDAC